MLAADIKHGIPQDCAQCPVARSITRGLKSKENRKKFGDIDAVAVTYSVALKIKRRHGFVTRFVAQMNQRVNRFLDKFDGGGKPCKPFSYVLTFEGS